MNDFEIDLKVKEALRGLIKVVDYKIDCGQVNIFGREGYAYNISSVTIECMTKAGFFLNIVTLTQESKPMVVFTTSRI